jgi:hypothetical protein
VRESARRSRDSSYLLAQAFKEVVEVVVAGRGRLLLGSVVFVLGRLTPFSRRLFGGGRFFGSWLGAFFPA